MTAEVRDENTWWFERSQDARWAVQELTNAGYRAQLFDAARSQRRHASGPRVKLVDG